MFSFVSSSPVLKALVLPDVTFTGRKIGAGAYSSIEEVVLSGAVCAGKTFHVTLQDLSQLSRADVESATHQFIEELQLMSTLRHPNVVQFLGVCLEPDGSAHLPALVMERLTCSLHDLLETNPSYRAKPLVPLPIKCSILQNVASGLAYLHHRSPPVIHGNLSARNILLDSAGRAKIAEVCEAPFIQNMGTAATIAKASLYMPPEAFCSTLSSKETSKTKSVYSTSIDIFSLGIIAIFTLGEALPCEPLEPTYTDKESGLVKYCTELERRSHYLHPITDLLNQGHPLLTLIQSCLCNNPSERPTVDVVLVLTERAKSMCAGGGMNKLELIASLQSLPGNEVAALRARNHELQQELETCRAEKLKLEEQIVMKEAQLATAPESLRQVSCMVYTTM
ncbi:Seven transmembrane domain-containing tyrosine-protein kinase 1 [Geodia barretti]|uniref:Seven transmembrane domain-containing tyrosine-protein kinase 1 n=1 Tax=Geodia barretti TaxID=519541 RepID=A0AA35X4W4_GEOBA|nr:Seven transmembrane domain-containing tyrosine-protein kinase 1 [Geodia barretti]